MIRLLTTLILVAFTAVLLGQKSTTPFRCGHYKTAFSAPAASASSISRSDSVDIEHVFIRMDFTNFSSQELNANATLSIKSKVNGLQAIRLDLLGLTVDSVIQDNNALSFNYNDTLLIIDLNSALNTNETADITVFYQGPPVQNSGDWGGFYWNGTYAYNIGVSFLEDPHNYGRVWMPCFDNFIERSTYEYEITTDANRKAFCNGLLQAETQNLDGSVTWHWQMNQEIPSYLASVSVANYATVNMTYNGIGSAPIPIQLAALPFDTTLMKNSFVNLIGALEAFEQDFGPYEFDRVGYCATSFNAGAMEHATNITYMRNALSGNTNNETLMAHELSHHWWGNLVTCADAEDMWLNEGWASYSESLFTEYVYGNSAFKDYVRNVHDGNLRTLHINDGGYYPVSGVSSDLTYSSTVYNKGATMAHSIRGAIGDAMFFSCVTSFLNQNKFTAITSDDLENYLSECSGVNLASFFDTWIYEPGHRHYAFSELEVVETDNNTFQIEGAIRQKLWETNGYTEGLQLELSYFDADWNVSTEMITVYGPCSSFDLEVDTEPVYIALDLNEKLSDGTVDNYQVIDATGNFDFGLARLELDVNSISDSALVRAVHHYIQPDPLMEPLFGLHLSPNRYFSIEGIWPEDFSADATYILNGAMSQASGYLDVDFTVTTEDSLVMLFKENPNDDWSLVDSFSINTLGNNGNQFAEITVHNVRQGAYVMAVRDKTLAPNMAILDPCIYTSINDVLRLDQLVRIYPNPTQEFFRLEILDEKVEADRIGIYNILGNKITSIELSNNKETIDISTSEWKKGTYIISLESEMKQIFSKKIVVN